MSATIGLWALGVNYPLLLGAFSGLSNVVPYLGPILGGLLMLTEAGLRNSLPTWPSKEAA